MHEQQVDVGRVIELAAAPLAECDHPERDTAGNRQTGRLEAGIGDVRDLPDNLVELGALEVPGGHAQHRAATEPSKAGRRAVRVDVGCDLQIEVLPRSRADHREDRRLVRVLHEEVRRRGREPEHLDRDGRHHRPVEDLARLAVLDHALPGRAREHRIGRLGERSLHAHAVGASGSSAGPAAGGGWS